MGSITPYGADVPVDYRPASSQPEWQELSLFWRALARRWRLVGGIVLGFVLLVAAISFIVPKSYTTTATVMAGNPGQTPGVAGQTELPVLNVLALQDGVQTAETFAALAQQEGVAQDVVRTLHLRITPLDLLQNHVSVNPTTHTTILNLSVSWHDPDESAKIANAFADAFIRKERDVVRSQAVAAIGFLSGEMPRAQADMQRTNSELARFQAANGFVDANAHTQDVVTKETNLEEKIETVALDGREAGALLNNATAQLGSVAPTINNAQQISVNPVLTDLRTKLEQVEMQLAQANEQYTPQHPLVISLTKQREDILAQIAREPAEVNSANTLAPNPVYQSLQQQIAQYKQRIDGDNAQLALLQKERSNMAPVLRQLPQQGLQLATLQQRAKLASDVYNALEQKYDDALVAKSTALSDISLVQPATADSAIVRPNMLINILAAFVIALILAPIAVIILEKLGRPVYATGDASLLGFPVIARIPMLDGANRRMLPWLQSMSLEAFLQLCVSLKLKYKRPLRTLAITSPSRNDGKSTVAYNLAKAMANLEQRVLLMDADLRRPHLHDLAECSNSFGLSDVLEDGMPLNNVVQQLSANLEMLPAGHSPANPVGLIQSPRFDKLMRDVAERYDMVIVDTPALTCVTDGYLLSSKTDASVLVIAGETTAESHAQEAVSRFKALGIENLVGIVLNKDRKRMDDYSDYFVRRTGALPGSAV
jgi:capsular exopolysaccharide synthesis family protein